MAPRTAMDLLRERAEEKLNDTTQQLGRDRQRCEKARTQLSQLEGYQQEYRQQLTARALGSGLPIMHLLSYQGFIQALSQVVKQHGAHVADCERTVTLTLGDWQNDRRRLNAFTTLKARADEMARTKENRQEQKLMDEFASQLFLRKHSA
ncbi:flagellar FliJ protein [Enterobacter sp. BIGb0383]|uniref:flagellar export protein FliJ n=1 Tax=unclassified Enterobacter TaxID=2608935 RepID=UPI000F48FE1B|nr:MULTISPECIES: flagellar export protein FliJ [unclassified Enterobacter]ROP58332.1 flagellar FliJ protein [Enterobacter sp. BIGb0383]ROS06780.1 flagellar FliJ protein [Enterobacter sp. BIGb0359]